jgi:flagellin
LAITLNTNSIASAAARALQVTQTALTKVLGRVSSGLRIVSAADDAAGSAVATNLSVQARASRQAVRNANDGLSLLGTAEGAVVEFGNLLDRMRELAVQGGSETLATTERTYLSNEFDKLEEELDRISQATEFNGINLTDGSTGSLTVQVGITSGTESEIAVILPDLASLVAMVTTSDLSSASNSQVTIDTVDTASDLMNFMRSSVGSKMNRLDSAISYQIAHGTALESAASRIQDADYAHETAEMTMLQVRQQAGLAALVQANSLNRSIISLLS